MAPRRRAKPSPPPSPQQHNETETDPAALLAALQRNWRKVASTDNLLVCARVCSSLAWLLLLVVKACHSGDGV
jgi:hypothetical protein